MLSPSDPNLLALIRRVQQDYDQGSVEQELVSDLCADAVEQQHQHQHLDTPSPYGTGTTTGPLDAQVRFNADALAGLLQQIRDEQVETRRLVQRVVEILGERS